MTARARPQEGFGKPLAILSLVAVTLAAALILYGSGLRRFVREALMQRVTSAHYEILSPPGALSHAAMIQFATQREALFTALNKKLGDAASNTEIRIVLDPKFPVTSSDEGDPQPYSVTGTSIRTKLNGQIPKLPAAADAEALLSVAWGKRGNPQIARWVANWLLGDWRGAEIGMAAAQVEQRLGHKTVDALLRNPAREIVSSEDLTLLGSAWISEIAEFGGTDAVRKLYSAKMAQPSLAAVTAALATTPLELDRKWQMWMYAYLAGMPAMQQESDMPMNMPMAK
jgi:hypothetical protein